MASKTPTKQADKKVEKPVDKKVDKPAKKDSNLDKDSWASLSGFDEDSSQRSIYKADSKNPKPLDVVPQKCSVLQAIETERSDLTNLKDSSKVLDNSLYRDYKAKKKYEFIKPDNVFFGDRDKAQPVKSTQPEVKPSSKEDPTKKQKPAEDGSDDYFSQAMATVAKLWSYFGY
ncbi:hypothetical protein M3Y97_00590100 [Aphelenchoides bicaudatus]|nr:hypothetical protein M3Y97_00590100 [Aphelenchoides bicaudatus]